jgi:hypothetical protein
LEEKKENKFISWPSRQTTENQQGLHKVSISSISLVLLFVFHSGQRQPEVQLQVQLHQRLQQRQVVEENQDFSVHLDDHF